MHECAGVHACMFPEARRGIRSLGGGVIGGYRMPGLLHGCWGPDSPVIRFGANAFNSDLLTPLLLLEMDIIPCPEGTGGYSLRARGEEFGWLLRRSMCLTVLLIAFLHES